MTSLLSASQHKTKTTGALSRGDADRILYPPPEGARASSRELERVAESACTLKWLLRAWFLRACLFSPTSEDTGCIWFQGPRFFLVWQQPSALVLSFDWIAVKHLDPNGLQTRRRRQQGARQHTWRAAGYCIERLQGGETTAHQRLRADSRWD